MGVMSWLRGDGWNGPPERSEQALDGRFTSRLGANGGDKWMGGLSASGHLTVINHYTARRNARNAMNESCQARAIVERFADTVVDTGLRLEMSPNIDVLGIPQEEAQKWARDVEARFDLWARDKNQHRAGTLTFYQYQRLYQIFQHRDNDIFTRLYYDDKDASLQNPLQFQEIDPDQVRGDALTTSWGVYGVGGGISTTSGFQVLAHDGIERDDRGREVSYKIYVRKTDGTYNSVDIPARTPQGRLLMLHGYRPEYAGQGRGYSRMAHAIQEFENITDFSSAAIKKAINQSCIVGFVQPSKDEDAVNPFEGIMTAQGAGPAADMFGSNPTNVPEGATVEPLPDLLKFYSVPEATIDTPGSTVIANLTKGSTWQMAGNTAPADKFDTFVDSFCGHLAASLSIPLEVVLMKFSNNYSASRATLLLFWRVACGWAAEMDADLMSPTVEMWLAGEIAAGRIIAPGWSDPRLRQAWLCKNWIGSPVPDIDPAKSARARRENTEIGLTNLNREARDLNGSSAAANIATNNALYKNFTVAPWAEPGNFPGGNEPKTATPAQPAQPGKKSKASALLERLEELIYNMEDDQ
jgi:capsid protein